MTDIAEHQAIRAEAEQSLAELERQRARVARDARFDVDLRNDLADIDEQIAACRRLLAGYCSECGHRLLTTNGSESCCWSPCARYGQPVSR